MPIYEYQCEACGQRFEEVFLSISQVPPELGCPACKNQQVRRLPAAPAIPPVGEGGDTTEAEDVAPPKPPVFGRKELNEMMKNRT